METTQNISVARPLAPEDIRRGQYVAILHVLIELLPELCASDIAIRPPKPVSTLWLPFDDDEPLKVRQVCLPFVLAKKPDGKARTLDVRRYRLALLPDEYGKKVFKLLKERPKDPLAWLKS